MKAVAVMYEITNVRVYVSDQGLVIFPLPARFARRVAAEKLYIELIDTVGGHTVFRLHVAPRRGAVASAPVRRFRVKGHVYKRVILPAVVSRVLRANGVATGTEASVGLVTDVDGRPLWLEVVAPAIRKM